MYFLFKFSTTIYREKKLIAKDLLIYKDLNVEPKKPIPQFFLFSNPIMI